MYPPKVMKEVLNELASLCEGNLGRTDLLTRQTWAAQTNVERAIHKEHKENSIETPFEYDHGSVMPFFNLLDTAKEIGDFEGILQAQLGMALALDEQNVPLEAEEMYKEAMELVKEQSGPHPEEEARVYRNYGLHLAERELRPQAETYLTKAYEASLKVTSQERAEVEGMARAALGIFLQHDKRLEEAKSHIKFALEILPSSHRDAIVGRSHLNAIESRRSCGCGDASDLRESISTFAQTFIKNHISFVDDMNISYLREGIRVELQRVLETEEREKLNQVLESLSNELKTKMQQWIAVS